MLAICNLNIAIKEKIPQIKIIIAINLLGAVLFVVLGITNHGVLLRMPGAYLMGGTAVLAWLGIS